MSGQLVVATGNRGKLREIRALLNGTGWTVLAPADLGLDLVDVVESDRSYLENALAKATAYTRVTGLPALADDSGLEVDSLDGRPGVLSARYGWPGTRTDAERTALLLRELEGAPPARRTARFRAVVVLALPGGRPIVREGVLEGRITCEPRGADGFGYDPIFALPDGRTLAEIGEAKQTLSHRARAVRALAEALPGLRLRQ